MFVFSSQYKVSHCSTTAYCLKLTTNIQPVIAACLCDDRQTVDKMNRSLNEKLIKLFIDGEVCYECSSTVMLILFI